jgi:hypothetical protein
MGSLYGLSMGSLYGLCMGSVGLCRALYGLCMGSLYGLCMGSVVADLSGLAHASANAELYRAACVIRAAQGKSVIHLTLHPKP